MPACSSAPRRSLLSSLGYSVSFLIVVLGRQQLFTESTLTAILPLLNRRQNATNFKRVLRLSAVVLVTNFIGTLIFAWVVSRAEPKTLTFLQMALRVIVMYVAGLMMLCLSGARRFGGR